MRHVSQSIAKLDGLHLATGKPAYVEDLLPGEALCVKLLRSPYAFARIKSIDTEQAERLDGVACVLTYRDAPNIRYTIAAEAYPETSPYDRLIFDTLVRYVGDPVAAVAAADEETAVAALKLIQVEYEVLEPVLDMESAEGHASVLHSDDYVLAHFNIGKNPARNIAGVNLHTLGDVDAELAQCAAVVDRTYYTQAQAHAMMETHRAFTSLDSRGRLQVVTATQSAFNVQRIMARALDIPQHRIHVIKPRIGGGFGGKNIALVEVYPALVTLRTGKTAQITLSRSECFACTNTRHAMKIRVRAGASLDGILQAIDLDVLADTGAYGEHAPDVLHVGGHNTLPIYHTPRALRYKAKAVYTNKTPAGAFRGFGAPQTNFSIESAVNELADKLQIDPSVFRDINIIRQGQAHPFLAGSTKEQPAVVQSSTLEQCIRRGKELIGWDGIYPRQASGPDKFRAVGMSIAMHGTGIANSDTAVAEIRFNYDGSYTLAVGAADLGTGSDTVLAQMAAEVLQTTLDRVNLQVADTDLTPYETGAYASSTTYVTGNAVVKAARLLREKILDGGKVLCGDPDAVMEFDGEILSVKGGSWRVTLDELAYQLTSFKGRNQLAVIATYGGETSPPPFVAGFAEVEVDVGTGKVQLLHYAATIDCGTLINPNLARIQAEGGLVQGIGFALFEEVCYDQRGRLLTDDFMQYKIPCPEDIGQLTVEFVPSYEPTGPFGAKSIGEVVFHTPSAAIVDAVFNATGVRMTRLPITPESVLAALQQQKKSQTEEVR